MAAHQQSAHVQVGLLLTQVRGEFLRASASDPASPARAAKALSQAFELLNSCDFCYRCRSHEDAAGGCGENNCDEGQLVEESRACSASVCDACVCLFVFRCPSVCPAMVPAYLLLYCAAC